MDVLVVGGGVSGLTCALRLREQGLAVALWARELPPRTTSNVAAAFWYPYKAEPPSRVLGWAALSHRRFVALAPEPGAGICVRRAIEILREPRSRPWWADAVPSLRDATPDELPPGTAHGWAFDAPVIDTRVYLPWLRARLEDAGVTVEQRALARLGDAPCEFVVNCAGLGARELCGDAGLYPIRGQLVHVRDPGVTAIVIDEDDPRGMSYVVPRGDDCVLGGSADEGDEDLRARPELADAIVARCEGLVPALAGATRLADVVGLRPGRASVRLEAERRDGRTVVHDYGHGGAGVTLSWGCAEEVVALVTAARTGTP